MFPSIDRIDNKKGYTQDNCRIIWAFFNMAFRDASIELQEKTLTLQYLQSINENGDNINEEINKIQSNLLEYN